MSGAGHMLHAIKSLKLNRDQLKSHRHKNRKTSGSNDASQTKPIFKTVSPDELNRIKNDIRAQARKSKRKELIISLSTIVGFALFVLWLIY